MWTRCCREPQTAQSQRHCCSEFTSSSFVALLFNLNLQKMDPCCPLRPKQSENISPCRTFFFFRTENNFRSCSSGIEKFLFNAGLLPLADTIVSLWSLCVWTMDVNLPPWIPPQPTICQRGTKSDVPPIMRAVLGNPAAESPPCRRVPHTLPLT